jgi:adenylate cyclase
MALEIERKFLVNKGLEPINTDGVSIRQGYLHIDNEKSIRVRIAGHHSFLTVKGPDYKGSRTEFEYEIPVEEAEYMLNNFCGMRIIAKIRRHLLWKKQLWEVDEFLGDNKGLWLAEIEMTSPDDPVQLPKWIGKEVTGDSRFYNTYLAQHPFITWK